MLTTGILEAVIGLPGGLFYGTGIPASILVINKQGAGKRKEVLFINADREYKEGKNQNKLRPEDIEKISHVYRNLLPVPNYSRMVKLEDLAAEDYNMNIRRYVDNAPPPEPQDVKAHLNGGIPESEVEAMGCYFENYPGTKELLFTTLRKDYLQFTPDVTGKEKIKEIIERSQGVLDKHEAYRVALKAWWAKHLPAIKAINSQRDVFDLYRKLQADINDTLLPLGILDQFKIRGSFAAYWNTEPILSDLKSVAASGWGAALIPDEEILKSQFGDLLEKHEQNQNRIAELQALFEEAEGEDYDYEESESGVLPKEVLKTLKSSKKTGKNNEKIQKLIFKHEFLVAELRDLKKNTAAMENRKEELVAAARTKITPEEAERLLVTRWERTLYSTLEGYLKQYLQTFVVVNENFFDKYCITLKSLVTERDQETKLLNQYLIELGYE